MTFKKCGKSIFGVDLNKAEEKALDKELRKELADYLRKHGIETVSMVLLVLRKEFGFGEARLRRFFDTYDPWIEGLIRRYELDECDDAWIATEMLKREGIDIEAWDKESEEK